MRTATAGCRGPSAPRAIDLGMNSPAITSDAAFHQVLALPGVRSWVDCVEGASKGAIRVSFRIDGVPRLDSPRGSEERTWHLAGAENHPTHWSCHRFFKVDPDSGDVFERIFDDGRLLWRAASPPLVHPVEAQVDPTSGILCPTCGLRFQPDMSVQITAPNTVRYGGLTAHCPDCCKRAQDETEPTAAQGHAALGDLEHEEEPPESGVWRRARRQS